MKSRSEIEMSPEGDIISSTPGAFRLRWDVFLSFRGTDTRHALTDHLYNALESSGVRVFRDDDGLNRGDEIAPSLLEAIDDSAASIVVLSPNYASSRWCLEELAKICDCRRLILPVFHCVDPSDVRKQKGPFEESFKIHEERFPEEKVIKWREAMAKVGGIAGWVFQNKNNCEEDKLIRHLVQRILNELSNTPVGVAEFTVGLDDRVEELMKLLDVKSNGARVLGLFGMGGIGKTTLSKALFNKLLAHFGRRSFISNVREASSTMEGLISLQNKLASNLSSETMTAVNDINDGIDKIRRIVNQNKVLVVLDDISDVSQLDSLIGKRELLYNGSRIIITTRDKQVLPESYVKSDELYEVKELKSSEALELFSHHALRRKKPSEKFMNLSNNIVSLTGGLPLALEVFGSFLFDKRRIEEWNDALKKLEQIRPGNLHDVLKISFDGLDEQEKCIFLDMACFFVGMEMKREGTVDVLRGCGFKGVEVAITVLTNKCLIKITEDNNALWMHDQIRDMGRQIVIDENVVDPGKRSRLWDRAEIMAVLNGKKGTRYIEGIVLGFIKKSKFQELRDRRADEITWDNFRKKPSCKSASAYMKERYNKYVHDRSHKARMLTLHTQQFQPMVGLRLLQINYSRMVGKFRYLPPGLKWLQWKRCPLRNIPSDYVPSELAVLDLSESQIETLWGRHSNKVCANLMVLTLSDCYSLVAIPDLTGYSSLEKIDLENCCKLIKIHESIGTLSSLVHLNMHQCISLLELPSDVSGLKRLESLILSDCIKLKALPKDISSMISLRQLIVDGTALSELPESIFHLTKLEKLSACGCHLLRRLPACTGKLFSLLELFLNHTALEVLPDSIGSLKNLVRLSLMGCTSLTVIPDSVKNLESLSQLFLDRSGIKELPASIGSLSFLRDLTFGYCKLVKLPESIGALASMTGLQIDATSITNLPDTIGGLKMLRKFEMRNCQNLRFLPATIGSCSALTTLDIYNSNITELPESIGMLENLVLLRLDMCKQLQRLPDSLGNLKSLRQLLMKETAISLLPDSFGMLSSLVVLNMKKGPYLNLTENNMPIEGDNAIVPSGQKEPNSTAILDSLSSLTLLEKLNAHGWRISGKVPDDFDKFSSLEIMKLGHNNICSLPATMKGLSCLKKLLLPECRELRLLPPLPSSLTEVNVANCTALHSISDISNLENLEELNLMNCEKVVDIPGLEHLKSLRRLYLNGCSGCSSAVKKRFSKVLLKRLEILIMPGSEIPDWFSGGEVRFSKQRNRKLAELRGIICGGVLSFNHIPQNQRDGLQMQLSDIQAKILNLTDVVYQTTFRLLGIPRTNQDHIFLRRFGYDRPLVSQVKDGYTLQVTKRNPAYVEGLELKKSGICLVFERDDDFDGDEESLDATQHSISHRLAKFCNDM